MRLKISNVQSTFVFIIFRQVICDSGIANIELTVKSVLDDLNNSTLFKISYGFKFSTAPPLSPLSVPHIETNVLCACASHLNYITIDLQNTKYFMLKHNKVYNI